MDPDVDVFVDAVVVRGVVVADLSGFLCSFGGVKAVAVELDVAGVMTAGDGVVDVVDGGER